MSIKLERIALTVWRIRLCFAALIAAFIFALFLKGYRNAIIISISTVSAVFLLMYLIYYPIKLKNLTTKISANNIIITDGVFYNKTNYMPLKSIQFINIISSPLQKVFGICTIIIKAAGATAYISGVSKASAEIIYKLLYTNFN